MCQQCMEYLHNVHIYPTLNFFVHLHPTSRGKYIEVRLLLGICNEQGEPLIGRPTTKIVLSVSKGALTCPEFEYQH